MLNYIWGGLIIFSLLFAVVNDANDIYSDTWKNGEQIELSIDFPANADINRSQPIRFTLAGDSISYEARWRVVDDEVELVIPVTSTLPVHWKNVAENQESSRKQELRATVISKSSIFFQNHLFYHMIQNFLNHKKIQMNFIFQNL